MTEIEQRLRRGADVPIDHEQLARVLADGADAAGTLDVAYGRMDSPLGELLVAVTPRGLVRIAYEGEPEVAVLAELAVRVSPRILRVAARTDTARGELEAYFSGARRSFDLPIDWSLVRGFAQQVLRQTARIPFGAVSSYGRVAAEAGSPRAYRAAGNALGSNPIPIVVPCHRVLHADGGLGGYAGGLDRKRFLLELEGALPA